MKIYKITIGLLLSIFVKLETPRKPLAATFLQRQKMAWLINICSHARVWELET